MFQTWEMQEKTMELYQGVKDQRRASLARAITLVESSNAKLQRQAQMLLTKVLLYMKGVNQRSEGGLFSFRIGKLAWGIYLLKISKKNNGLVWFGYCFTPVDTEAY
jgi:hypothetical protein